MGQGVLRAALQRGRQRQNLRLALAVRATVRETIGRPSVSVPVLSKAKALSLPAASSAAPPLTRIPRLEAAPIPETTVTGVEITRAHGQAMIRSASAR